MLIKFDFSSKTGILVVKFAFATAHSRPQSLRSFWPAAGIERLWEQPFQACAIDVDYVRPDGQNSVISFVISKWLLPELSIPAAGQKDRRLWGRECMHHARTTRVQNVCACARSICKLAVANANFTTRMPVLELKSYFISIQNFKAGNVKPPGMHWNKDF